LRAYQLPNDLLFPVIFVRGGTELDCLDPNQIARDMLVTMGGAAIAHARGQISALEADDDAEGVFIWELVLDVLLGRHLTTTARNIVLH
jgi:hypothetical protein